MNIATRIISSILLIALIPLLTWWLWVLVVIAVAFLWTSYYEIIFIGFIYDLIVGTQGPSWWFPATLGFVCVLVFVEIIKTRLIVYRHL